MARIARSVEDVILGEAVHGTREERLADMMAIASVIANRAAMTKSPPKDIVSVRAEFNAYGKALPAGVEKYRALAEEAWNDVQTNGPVHSATFYATPSAAHRVKNGKVMEASTTGHQFFSDPEFRPFRTAAGYKRPDPSLLPSMVVEPTAYAAIPSQNPALEAIENVAAAPLDAAAQTAIENAIAQDGLNELGVAERTGYQSPMGALGDRITSGFGARTAPTTVSGRGSRNHAGLDLSLEPGAMGYPAETMGAGVVSNISYSPGGYGKRVDVRHPDGLTSSYSHLSSIADNLEIGTEVAAGTPVGTVGSTGNSSGPHLHFEVRDEDGNAIDPASVVSFNRENAVATPTAAQRTQPGDLISGIANEAVQPSLGDPNEALAAAFDMDRFAGPTQEQVANFDTGRFGDPNAALTESFDMARMGGANVQPAQSEQALAEALASSNNQAAMRSQQMADMQERANEARRALEERAALSAQETQNASLAAPIAIDGQTSASTGLSAAADAAGITPRSMADLAGQYAAYGAGKISPEQNLAADVLDQAVNTKQARTPSYALAQQKIDQTQAVDPAVDVASLSTPAALGDVETDMADVTYSQPSRAKQSVQQRKEAQQPEAVDPDKGRLARSFTNSKTLGSALGATIGGILGGPVGAMALGAIGSKLGNMPAAERPRETPLQALFNMMSGKPQSMFPTTPAGGQGTGKGVSFNDLNERGRDTYRDSGDFRDAIDKGGVGLY